MRPNPGTVLSILFVFLLAACADGTPADPTATAAPSATATATADATTEPTSTPDDFDDLALCTSDPMPDLDSGWTGLDDIDGTFLVAYPDHWEDLSGEVDFAADSLIDEETFAELGLDSDAIINASFVREPTGVPNLSVFHFGTVDSSTTEVYEREVARYADFPSVERIVETDLEECLGGTRARGLSMEFVSSDGLTYYQQNLVAVREGELYVVQWLDETDPDLDLLAEILTTWGWRLPPLEEEPSGTGGIAEAHMATVVDESLDTPDPSTFTTSFPTDAPAIYVVYTPDEGASGTVHLTWLHEGEVASEATLDIGADTIWAWGGITPPSGGFTTGSYEVRVELNGDEERVAFTVED